LKFLEGLLAKIFFAIWFFMKSTVYFQVGGAHPAHPVDKSLLTTSDLSRNRIGDQGAEYLANALRQNQVTRLALLYFSFNHAFINSHRH
jgi:hypothetical protein